MDCSFHLLLVFVRSQTNALQNINGLTDTKNQCNEEEWQNADIKNKSQ